MNQTRGTLADVLAIIVHASASAGWAMGAARDPGRYNPPSDPMSLLTASDLSKAYGAQDVFAGVSLAIPRQARLALVGPNGVGKTTLLSILAGVETPDGGRLQRARHLRIGYLRQEAVAGGLPDSSVWTHALDAFGDLRQREVDLAALEVEMADPARAERALARYGPLQEAFERDGGYHYAARARQVLNGLGFRATLHGRRLSELSGGERTRAELARLLLEDPELLLLDEPTNHLDLSAIEWLESWLSDWPGSAVIVSHDRYFLDRTVEQVWELHARGLDVYPGNYSAYAAQRSERRAFGRLQYEADQARIAREQDYIRRNIAGQNTRQAKGRRKRLERHLRETAVDRPPEESSLHLTLPAGERAGDRVLETHGLVVAHPGTGEGLFSVPDLVLGRGECAAVLGPNGAGKTSFLRTLLGEQPAGAGEARLGARVTPGYFDQASRRLHGDHTLLQEILSLAPSLGMQKARDWLARFHFSGDAVDKPIEALSGGERGRLALACLALAGANLLLLDEPTNHLDLPSQEALQAALAEFPGTILLVSHDRYLVRALAHQVWTITPGAGALQVFRGGYDEMVEERRRQEETRRSSAALAKPRPARPLRAAAGGRDARALETRITELEGRLQALEVELSAAAADVSRVARLGEEYVAVEAELDARLAEWAGGENPPA
jgi:ATP-binding cassette subfamily F protein 3